ncbi:MAG: hypothetical protein ACR2JG_10255 [Geodermatophilaceae bacterium]
MPDHSPAHMARLTRESAAQRRADKIARLLISAPLLSEAQVRRLQTLLEARVAAGGTR